MGRFYLALGFGSTPTEAAFRARASLQDDFNRLAARYAGTWRDWQKGLRDLDRPCRNHNGYRISTAVLRTHEAPSFPGGFIASLSIPWGATKGDDDLGGYHLVWPRDLVETAGGLLAADAFEEAVRVLDYLRTTQEPDGHWPQNNWLDGSSYWQGVQMDECAFPILLVDLALRAGALNPEAAAKYWPMVRAACLFVVRNGPVTGQDRWEENAGYSTFTLAVEIAALLAAADCADAAGQGGIATYLRETADAWNDAIEEWCYARDTPLAREIGVDGYYVRMAPDRPPNGVLGVGRRGDHQEPAGRAGQFSRPPDYQPGCAGAGAVRPAGCQRSAGGEYGGRDRCQDPGGIAGWAVLVPVQLRRLWRARRWASV